MKLNLLRVVVPLSVLVIVVLSENNSKPDMVRIGAIFSFGTINGRVAKIAMNAAIEDVNSDPRILGGRKLVLSTHDSNYSGFLGIIGGLQFLEADTVAIIGPQASGMAHILSNLANELHVPMLSFTALDPSLSSLQFPYFLQTAPNDLYQMTAIADMVSYFGYKEVVAIYTDDEQSRGTITALGDKLAERRCKISYKAILSPEAFATREEIMNQLVKVSLMESRVIVVHAFAVVGLKVFELAQRLKMENGYVWIATGWLSTVLDSSPVSGYSAKAIQGVLTLRPHTADSTRKKVFESRWKKLSNGSIGLNPYGLYAYDTVLMIANAVREFLERGGIISFSNDPILSSLGQGVLNISALSKFDGGKQILANILETNMTGLTGQIAFHPDKSMIRPSFDILNVIGEGYKQIGYWCNYSGLSTVPPDILYNKAPNRSSANQQLHGVMWPGRTTIKPRGWVFPHNGRPLRIGIPDRVSYKAFVSEDEKTNEIHGYCVEVFLAALKLLPYAVPHEFILFGDKHKNPSYSELVNLITTGVFDAAVGDIAIVRNRTKIVDFTQPYIESGLVVVAPVRKLSSSAWAFLRPFTAPMWVITGVFFIMVGVVVWILEHKINDDFRGPPKKQLITILWWYFKATYFSVKTLIFPKTDGGSGTGRQMATLESYMRKDLFPFVLEEFIDYSSSFSFLHVFTFMFWGFKSLPSSFFPLSGENTMSSLGRMVLIIWLFVVLIITSSYTANLTSILTVQQLAPSIRGIESLITSNDHIGFQVGSFAEDYLKEEINIAKSRLVPLGSPEEYSDALKNGSVSAIVDERPYMELFLSSHCKFQVVGQEFTKSGWGFAFPRDSPIAMDMSTAILTLSENGELQKIHDKWLKTRACSLANNAVSDQFQLNSFWGLFLICGTACFFALMIYFCKMIRMFNRYFDHDSEPSTQNSSRPTQIQKFLSFVDEKEEELKNKLKRKHSEATSRGDSEELRTVKEIKFDILS